MTGTSLDGLDVALARITGCGEKISARCIGLVSKPLGALGESLLALAEGQSRPPIYMMSTARALGQLHAEAIMQLCSLHLPPSDRLDLVVAHGQTICHAPNSSHGSDRGTDTRQEPSRGGASCDSASTFVGALGGASQLESSDVHWPNTMSIGLSWQLFDPWPVVRQLGTPVLFDLRGADLIAGGQGAPITPMADAVLYRGRADLVVNLGGICNVTDLRGEPTGLDLCPCNLLIDRVVQVLYPRKHFDQDGALAALGNGDASLFRPLVYSASDGHNAPQSMGREDVGGGQIEAVIARAQASYSAHDIIASAVEAVAERIAGFVIDRQAQIAVLAGGGARNRVLFESIHRHSTSGKKLICSDDLDIPCEAREALCLAVLGALTQDGMPITHHRVTGAHSPGPAGVWAYP